LEDRETHALHWLTSYAPAEYQYRLQESLPEGLVLNPDQKKALGVLARFVEEAPRDGEALHQRLHELKTEIPVAPKELFQALYRVFLNRDSGPKAGWFLSVLPQEYVVKMLSEAAL
jgi:lysyl-tRNA synthetase class 1